MIENYRIPPAIKKQLDENFYAAMWKELQTVFGDSILGRDCDLVPNIVYFTGTAGWHRALEKTAPTDVLLYWDDLDWFDSDMFDCEIADEIIKRFVKITNYDKLRAMSYVELADALLDMFAAFYDVEWSKDVVLDFLKEEAE